MLVAIALAVLWATDVLTVPLMGALAVVGGSLGTLSFPAFQRMLASTVPEEDLESAVAINSLSLQLARFLGPAIAGVLLATKRTDRGVRRERGQLPGRAGRRRDCCPRHGLPRR